MDQIKTGKFIAAMRKYLGLTQETLGEKLGVTNKTISRWETGVYIPDIDKLQELASILEVSVNELLSGEKITDEKTFAEKADENLVELLTENSTFGLKDRIAFFKRKWLKEHVWFICGCIIFWVVFVIIAVLTKHLAMIFLVPALAIFEYVLFYNKMMAYVEQNAFRK